MTTHADSSCFEKPKKNATTTTPVKPFAFFWMECVTLTPVKQKTLCSEILSIIHDSNQPKSSLSPLLSAFYSSQCSSTVEELYTCLSSIPQEKRD